MQLKLLKPKQALNKAYLKEKLVRSEMEVFKNHFKTFLDNTKANKNDEEHLKAQVAYFLRDTFYKDSYHINPIGKNDLVIHNGKNPSDLVGAIIEVKSLTNKAEMLSEIRPNVKALHELVLYYLRQRLEEDNNQIKYLIATNIDDWFLFDAN
jgi:adenine-specific DNA-methyltransferase